MQSEIIGDFWHVGTIAVGHGIRELARLKRIYGAGRWRKGLATVRMRGDVVTAELHWYECHGIGKREIRLKGVI